MTPSPKPDPTALLKAAKREAHLLNCQRDDHPHSHAGCERGKDCCCFGHEAIDRALRIAERVGEIKRMECPCRSASVDCTCADDDGSECPYRRLCKCHDGEYECKHPIHKERDRLLAELEGM